MSLRRREAAFCACLAALCVASAASGADEEETPWTEEPVTLPSGPVSAELLEFDPGPTSRNRYFVDGRSISVGSDRVVRYALIVRSGAGVSSASYEGLRCDTAEFKIFGTARADGSWARTSQGVWRPLFGRGQGDPRRVLAGEFFCPDGRGVGSAEEIVSRLRTGGRWSVQR